MTANAIYRCCKSPSTTVWGLHHGARSKFNDRLALNEVCGLTANDPIRLLRAGYLIELYKAGKRLPRRQDVPSHGFWTKPIGIRTVIIVVSYPWLSPTHPDPDSFHMAVLAPLLSVFVRYMAQESLLPDEDVAVFIDYSCLFQDERTASELEMFRTGLKSINLLYAHARTSVWCLTRLPDGAPRPYIYRGWCKFEYNIASIIKSGRRFLDLGALTEIPDVSNFAAVGKACSAARRPPELPSNFEGALWETTSTGEFTLTFTNGKDDRPFVARKYQETFEELMRDVDLLDYCNLGWEDSEVLQLAKVLPACASVVSLKLNNNRITDVGARVLAGAFPPSLEELQMRNNPSMTFTFEETLLSEVRFGDLNLTDKAQRREQNKRDMKRFKEYYATQAEHSA